MSPSPRHFTCNSPFGVRRLQARQTAGRLAPRLAKTVVVRGKLVRLAGFEPTINCVFIGFFDYFGILW